MLGSRYRPSRHSPSFLGSWVRNYLNLPFTGVFTTIVVVLVIPALVRGIIYPSICLRRDGERGRDTGWLRCLGVIGVVFGLFLFV
ncbi:hypothetical protein VTJ04DRAFT_10580 [Mycothermus thermophilus]|uniref:uncharacterized protein n=1 Tax=Humicola insolens TaxID=85995 RepID=UPI003742EB7E